MNLTWTVLWSANIFLPGRGFRSRLSLDKHMKRPVFIPDNFTLALLGTVLLAVVLPARGPAALAVRWASVLAVALLFFLHGAKMSRESLLAGLINWRLHLLIVGATFGLFPLLGWGLSPLWRWWAGPELY